ncbi:hypothetical protein P5673_026105 [Acropora cervicornis]|uniref:Uncharacterized protein n=1 Tax=Acropora cervicornis TaxID=6130 RepID=A0AAD9UWX3_ACRCE|nr:hypothetical protein P5673_026105 [Acropora cervicornis]
MSCFFVCVEAVFFSLILEPPDIQETLDSKPNNNKENMENINFSRLCLSFNVYDWRDCSNIAVTCVAKTINYDYAGRWVTTCR